MLAVVMAGGIGKRLRPLTCDKPKPMVPVANRPLLEHVLALLGRNGWDEIILTLHYLPDRIRSYFSSAHPAGMRLCYVVEDRPLGTAGSVRAAVKDCRETLLVGSGDALSDFDLRAALEFHRQKQALVTIVLARVASPLEYGVVMTTPEGRIERFLEKPGWGEVFSDTVNTGFYLIEPRALAQIPLDTVYDFSRDLFPRLLAQGESLYGYIAEGYWSDIGTLEQYRQAQLDVLAGRIRLIPSGREVGPGIRVGRGTTIEPGAVLEGPVMIGDYCRVEKGAVVGPETVIGDHGLIAAGSSIKRSVIWRHAYLGAGTEVKGAVVCDHVVLRNGSTVFEGAVIGDGSSIGSYAAIRPQVKLWPGKTIESGSIVRDSMIWNGRSLRGLFGGPGITGAANVELTPEFLVKIGAAFAAGIGRGRQLAVACDGLPASRLLKRAATTGILGAGIGVKDFGSVTVPMLRFGVSALGLAGGMHLGMSDREPGQAVVQFLDHKGLPLGRQAERAVEQSFFAEDFPRVAADQVGEPAYVVGVDEMYLEGIEQLVDPQAIGAAGLRVMVVAPSGPAAAFLPRLLARLNCRYQQMEPVQNSVNISAGSVDGEIREKIAAELAAFDATLAVGMDDGAEELYLYDRQGRLLPPAKIATLLSLVELCGRDRGRIPVPVTATEAIADLARTYRGEVVRIKAQRRYLLEEMAAEPGVRGLLLPAFDALVSLAKLLAFLAEDGRPLGAILDELPAYHRVEKAVPCAWEVKGQLMRRLVEEYRGRNLELTDGIKIKDATGWALILPDGEEPFIRIYSEAGSIEEADALNRFCRERISAIQAGNPA